MVWRIQWREGHPPGGPWQSHSQEAPAVYQALGRQIPLQGTNERNHRTTPTRDFRHHFQPQFRAAIRSQCWRGQVECELLRATRANVPRSQGPLHPQGDEGRPNPGKVSPLRRPHLCWLPWFRAQEVVFETASDLYPSPIPSQNTQCSGLRPSVIEPETYRICGIQLFEEGSGDDSGTEWDWLRSHLGGHALRREGPAHRGRPRQAP